MGVTYFGVLTIRIPRWRVLYPTILGSVVASIVKDEMNPKRV